EAELEDLRIRFLGRKGDLTLAVRQFRDVDAAERPVIGALLNEIKDDLERRITEAIEHARAAQRAQRASSERIDVTVPARGLELGHLHPITQQLDELIDIFAGPR